VISATLVLAALNLFLLFVFRLLNLNKKLPSLDYVTSDLRSQRGNFSFFFIFFFEFEKQQKRLNIKKFLF
jgi:hypothetical protein